MKCPEGILVFLLECNLFKETVLQRSGNSIKIDCKIRRKHLDGKASNLILFQQDVPILSNFRNFSKFYIIEFSIKDQTFAFANTANVSFRHC